MPSPSRIMMFFAGLKRPRTSMIWNFAETDTVPVESVKVAVMMWTPDFSVE
jgi:hypothetical protein